ncbi:hydrogenase iron-sulfur subunit [Spirochaetota bacterium]
MDENFEPRIVGFLCKWCTYAGADLAGTSRMKYPSNIRVIRTMCSGRIDPTFILDAFKNGADGVFIGGCHPGDCHYIHGNYFTMKKVALFTRVMEQLGINKDRLCLQWISAAEAKKYTQVMKDFTETIRKLGPFKKQEAIA